MTKLAIENNIIDYLATENMVNYKISTIHGFDFPYKLEYFVDSTILIGLGILFILALGLLILEITVPHINSYNDEPEILER